MTFEIDELNNGCLHKKEYVIAALAKTYDETLECSEMIKRLRGPGDTARLKWVWVRLCTKRACKIPN